MVKMFTLACATLIVLFAFSMGYDGELATLAVLGLFGGEKLLGKVLDRIEIKSSSS